MKELWLRQRSKEHTDSHIEVLVLLHVKVDELRSLITLLVYIRIVDGSLIKLRHATHQFGEALLVVQRVGLGIDAGNLDRDVVDVWLFQCLNRVVITLVGLFVS